MGVSFSGGCPSGERRGVSPPLNRARDIGRRQSGGPAMRKVTFGVANSLDNYIARKDHAVDWLLWGKEAASFMTEYWKTIDTVVMGRKTYEVALRLGGGSASYPGVTTYVCSRTIKESPDADVRIISDDAGEFVRRLKKQKGKDICVMGGGELARSLFEADVIDEVGLNIHPVLLGSGIPLFLPLERQINLKLLDCKTFKNGCVLVMYRVKPKRARPRASAKRR
jgi:dihydrofolate reductase